MPCSPSKLKFLINPPNFIFKKSCSIHDKDYLKQKGKIKADFKFLKNMLENVKKSNSNIFKKAFLYLITLFYFFMVVVFGYLFYIDKEKHGVFLFVSCYGFLGFAVAFSLKEMYFESFICFITGLIFYFLKK